MDNPLVISDLSPANVAALLGLIIPALVALLAKADVPNWVKLVLNMVLSALSGAVATLVASDGGFAWTTFLLSALAAFFTSLVTYLGVYKPFGIADKIEGATPNVLVGSPEPPLPIVEGTQPGDPS